MNFNRLIVITALAGSVFSAGYCSSRSFSSTDADLKFALSYYLFNETRGLHPWNCFHPPVIRNFTADGSPSEFSAETLYASDASGDSTGPAGTDLKDFHVASDGKKNFYFYMSTDAALPIDTGINWNFANNYWMSIWKDANGAYSWSASTSTNESCNTMASGIAENGKGKIELKIPFSCLDVTLPVLINMTESDKWRIPKNDTSDYDDFDLLNSECIYIE